MNNIIYFDICAFIILAIFISSMLFKKQMRDRANTMLLILMELAAIATIGDFMAAYIENYYEASDVGMLLAYAATYLFFLAHNLMFPIYTLYIYATADIWHIYKQNKATVCLWWGLVSLDIVLLIINHFTHIMFTITEDLEYVRGPFIIVYYLAAAFFGLWGLWIIIKYKGVVRHDKAATLIILYPIITSAIIIQAIWPNVLVEMLSVAVAVLFFMIVLQRHEYQIDPITGAMKYATSIERINAIFAMHKPITITFINIVNHNNIRLYLGQSRYNDYLRAQTTALSSIAFRHNYPVDVFYLENGTYGFLSDDYDINNALPIAEEVKEHMSKPMDVDGFSVISDARICVVRCPEDVEDFSTIFTLATTFHETLGKINDVVLYAEHRNDRDFMIRNEMDEILLRALDNRSFEMYYQPIYSTTEDRFVSAEALIRLKDERFGFIPPGVFIPMAESSGAIHEIGDYVLDAVFDFIARNDLDELGLKYIEINLSAAQCIEVDLVDKILHMIATKGIDATRVSLEITETAANINPAIVDSNVHRLHDEGIRFALDDYGTGYSNIRRVTTLPVDQVKLDKSFVDDIDNPQMWIVIRDTIMMLREMGKEVLVEGVETKEVAERLIRVNTDLLQGCELIQGFYFCKPLPESEFTEFIKSRL